MDSDAIRITVAGPPVAKGRPKMAVTKAGHAMAYTPAKTRKYEAHARLAAQAAMNGRAPLDGPVCVHVEAWLPIPSSWSRRRRDKAVRGEVRATKRPDADNYLKAALDACSGIVFADDSQVVGIHVEKQYGESPLLRIEVAPVEGERA